ncbi:MAG TPA: hypothetical protein VGQ51_13235 [Puia sp.]|jgi:hypothetical protein|nr:hypothetical protein [Puia sp.]
MQRINLTNIQSVNIVAIPSETITGREFRYSNIARIRTRDGGDYDILFDERGEPVTDFGLMERVGKHYGKKFQAIVYDGRAAYAEINGNSDKSVQKQGPQARSKIAVAKG